VKDLTAVSEASFQKAVIEYAQRCGWEVRHVHDSRRQVVRKDGTKFYVGDALAAGLPDLFMWRGVKLTMAELKTDRGTLRPAQVAVLDALQKVADASGGALMVAVWRPRDWPTIEEALR
jgi:hypothetical protein